MWVCVGGIPFGFATWWDPSGGLHSCGGVLPEGADVTDARKRRLCFAATREGKPCIAWASQGGVPRVLRDWVVLRPLENSQRLSLGALTAANARSSSEKDIDGVETATPPTGKVGSTPSGDTTGGRQTPNSV